MAAAVVTAHLQLVLGARGKEGFPRPWLTLQLQQHSSNCQQAESLCILQAHAFSCRSRIPELLGDHPAAPQRNAQAQHQAPTIVNQRHGLHANYMQAPGSPALHHFLAQTLFITK
jgi:hypothetical protein